MGAEKTEGRAAEEQKWDPGYGVNKGLLKRGTWGLSE